MKKYVVDHKGEATAHDLTAKELKEKKAHEELKEAKRLARKEAVRTQRSLRASVIVKLMALGLTTPEIKSIFNDPPDDE